MGHILIELPDKVLIISNWFVVKQKLKNTLMWGVAPKKEKWEHHLFQFKATIHPSEYGAHTDRATRQSPDKLKNTLM